MIDFDITKREHFAEWSQEELGGRAKARLVARPLRTYVRQDGSGERPFTFVVYQTKGRQRHEHREVLPEGLYQCYLADSDDPALVPLAPEKRIFIGEKRRVSVERTSLRPGHAATQLTIRSPLTLKAGECGLDYGLPEPVFLPETRPEGAVHVIRCILPRFRPELSLRLWFTPELQELLLPGDSIL